MVAEDYYRQGIEINKTLGGQSNSLAPAMKARNHAATPRRTSRAEKRLVRTPRNEETSAMWTQRLMWIAWPAFLMAGVLEMLVFALVDPQDMHWFGQPLALSREGVYTIAFLLSGW